MTLSLTVVWLRPSSSARACPRHCLRLPADSTHMSIYKYNHEPCYHDCGDAYKVILTSKLVELCKSQT